ncbi:MAG TPA: MerR family transcriptional regulator [Myxococcaceae bacterium]|jgi:DNA-binding transcriptional MerR regulator/methylmalonyl-CoA mutase cobalamin-binding subunit
MAERNYRILVASQLSGVRVELIRAWERRYGVPHPQRTPSGYRLYTERDVALLKRLKQLTEEGMAISEAVKLAPQLQAEAEASTRQEEPRVEVSPTQLAEWRAAVLEAAAASDQERVSRVLDEVLSALPALKAFDEVLAPVQCEVGDRWHAGTLTVAQEHLVSQMVRARVVSLLHAAPGNAGARHGVLACLPDELHEVGLLGAALRLRHAGLRVTVLGQLVPAEDLGRMVRELRPDFVGLSAVTNPGPAAFEQRVSQVLGALPPGVPVWIGGAAAEAYTPVCERHGARVFRAGSDWAALLA